jgi:hypothetical protein
MNPVFAYTSSCHDDQIAGIRPFLVGRFASDHPWHDTPCSAVDQRVTQIAVIEKDGAVKRRNAQPVAVVSHSRPDSLENAAGMQHAFRQLFIREVGGSKAEYIRIQYGLSAQTSAKRVADHSAN